MKKISYKVYLLTLLMINMKSMNEKEEKENQRVAFTIKMQVSEKLVKELSGALEKFGSEVKNVSAVESLIDYIENQNLSFKERFKKRAGKAWAGTKGFGKGLKDKTAAGWGKIKENPKTTAAVVGGLAALGGGAYFFREGISQNLGKVKGLSGKGWNMAKEKGSSAWEYAREIPGKVKSKFRKG